MLAEARDARAGARRYSRSVDRALDELQKKRGLRIEHHRYGNHYLVDALRLAPESTLVSSRVDTGVQSGPHRNGRESTLVSSRVDIDVDSRVDTGVHQSRRECPVHEKSIRKTITEEQQQEQQHAAAPADGTQANDAAGAGASAEPVSIDGHQAQGDAALLDSLLEIGVERAAAVTILKEHSAADVARQLEWLPYRKAANPAGMFVRAIRGGWGVPKGLAQQKQREADEREELEDAARRRAPPVARDAAVGNRRDDRQQFGHGPSLRIEIEERLEGQVGQLLLDVRRVGVGEERVERSWVGGEIEAERGGGRRSQQGEGERGGESGENRGHG